MPHLFSELRIKDVTLRNRIAVSPMTQYSAEDGVITDWHFVHLGARAVGGAGLVTVEQAAVSPEGRMSVGCVGLWNDTQMEALKRLVPFLKSQGAVPGVQLGHTGRKGSVTRPWEGDHHMMPEDDPRAWDLIGPSDNAYGGKLPRAPKAMTKDDILRVQDNFAAAAKRALEAGFEWLNLHYAHGFLGASFFSTIANQRTDEYGGSVENRCRFLIETFDAVRAVWPERYPLTMRLGCTDFHPDSQPLDDAVYLIRTLKDRGLDLADLSIGGNTEEAGVPWTEAGFMLSAADYIKRRTGLPTAAGWNLGDPSDADAAIRSGKIDLLMLGRPCLANPHWPVQAAQALGHNAPYDLLPVQYSYWLNRFKDLRDMGDFRRWKRKATARGDHGHREAP